MYLLQFRTDERDRHKIKRHIYSQFPSGTERLRYFIRDGMVAVFSRNVPPLSGVPYLEMQLNPAVKTVMMGWFEMAPVVRKDGKETPVTDSTALQSIAIRRLEQSGLVAENVSVQRVYAEAHQVNPENQIPIYAWRVTFENAQVVDINLLRDAFERGMPSCRKKCLGTGTLMLGGDATVCKSPFMF